MECVETAALRASLWRETSSQFCFDEQEIGSTTVQNVVGSDDFSVDELLDLSNDDGFIKEEEDDMGFAALSGSVKKTHQSSEISNPSSSFAVKDELSFPADDSADLEWLSNLVEDCFSEYSEPFPVGVVTAKPLNQAETRLRLATVPRPPFKTPVPAKARSKRTRTGGRVWSLGSPPLAESSSSSSTSSFSPPSPTTPHLFHKDDTAELFYPPEKKPKKKENGEGSQVPRRCSHCGVQKTPQWRTGPLGAKTLCNACGVRYKSGRLLPEYRPACSPTFSSEIHSNHHRKVLEMRRKKEVLVVRAAPNSGPTTPAVSSFESSRNMEPDNQNRAGAKQS